MRRTVLRSQNPETRNKNPVTRNPEPGNLMDLVLVGISHRTAPVELRERVDFHARGIERAVRAVAGRAITREAVVLSTCNRAEIYASCDEIAGARVDLVRFVTEFTGVDGAEIAPHVYDL